MFDDDQVPFYVGTCNNCGHTEYGTKPTVCEGCGLDVEDEQ